MKKANVFVSSKVNMIAKKELEYQLTLIAKKVRSVVLQKSNC